MKKFTEKVHTESCQEAVWVKQNTLEEEEAVVKEPKKWPIIYSKKYAVQFGGLEKLHPFDAAKGRHIQKLLEEKLMLTEGNFYQPSEITKDELYKVHTRKYLRSLKWSWKAAEISEIPLLIFVPNFIVQRGYLRPMRYQTAGSILAGKIAINSGWAVNLGGGFHHCCSYKGGGFCPYADITLLITRLMEDIPERVRKVMIVDLDAHQGNGHERDFLDNDSVFILDMYNAYIYPHDNPAKLAISCAVEMKPQTSDDWYLKKLKRALLQSINVFKPDFVVYNAGTDILTGDPLGLLDITPEGVIARDHFVFSTFRNAHIPIVMLLSGGYLKRSAIVIADSIKNLNDHGLF